MPIEEVIPYLYGEASQIIAPEAIKFAIFFAPVMLAVVLAWIFWYLWLAYIRSKFIYSLKYAVLEVKLPKETMKSPLAMEVFLAAIHNTSDGGWWAQYWKGEFRPYFSLEVVSIEGQVKFFIWCEDRRKANMLAALYSQYPRAEVIEHGDYTLGTHFDPETTKVWACEFIKSSKEGDALPIKTYVDFGLEKDPKEEFKVDPMSYMLEFLGSVPPNSQIWMQFVSRAHKSDQRMPGHLFKRTDLWKDNAKKLIHELIVRIDDKFKISGKQDPKSGFFLGSTLSKGEQMKMEAIERAQTKLAYDVGIRVIYIAKKEIFDTPFGIGGCISSFKQYATENLNGIKPNGDFGIPSLDAPWKDFNDVRRNKYSKQFLEAYKRRSFFYPPYDSKWSVYNSEELATMYHFPGSAAPTPMIDRIPSKKAEAPANLPL